MNAQLQDTPAMHPRQHCPPDVEPAVYVRLIGGGWLPLVLAESRPRGWYIAWTFGRQTMTGCSANVVRRMLAEGKAVRAADFAEVPPC